MPLPGFPYATIVGFGFLVVAAGLLMLFANQQQQVPIGYGSSRRRSPSPPHRGGSWSRPTTRETTSSHAQGGDRSGVTERKRKTNDAPSKTSTAGYDCIICLDSKEVNRHVTLGCGHRFHLDCLSEWFQASQKGKVCPMCNAVATSR